MKKMLNLICMPIVLIGAFNYGLVGASHLFGSNLDLLGFLANGTIRTTAEIAIGASAIFIATGFAKK
jgi:uncharacterized membrane protein YuzA (DUF378 family)